MTIGWNASSVAHRCWSCDADAPARTVAVAAMWWTITTSSTHCAASRWRCSTWSIATSCSRARRIATAGGAARRAAAAHSLSNHGRLACPGARSHLRRRTGDRAGGNPRHRRAARPGPVAAAIRAAWHGGADRHRHIAGGHHLRRPAWFAAGVAAAMSAIEVDTTRLPLLLHELRLPAIARLWSEFADRTDKEGWPAARSLAALAELEIAERGRRRIVRHLAEARLSPGKTLDNFDFSVVPMLSKARVIALAAGDAWLDKASNLLCFGPPGAGKSHLASAIGGALVENGYRVLFTRTTDIVQKLQAARQALQLEAAINRLDRYDLLILDDLSYVHKDHAETSVLFELIGARYERRSMLITANQPFADWNKVFPDQAMMIAAVDRLVHHSIIFEMNVGSYRRRGALDRKARAAAPGKRQTEAAES